MSIGGYRVQRTTKPLGKLYDPYAQGHFQIPDGYAPKYSATDASNNTVPELFIGIYTKTYGLDIGLVCCSENGNPKWKAFCNTLGNTKAPGQPNWEDYEIPYTINPKDILHVETEIYANPSRNIYYISLSLDNEDWEKSWRIKRNLSPQAVQDFLNGSIINTETNLVSNMTNEDVYTKTQTYFYNAKSMGFCVRTHTTDSEGGIHYKYIDLDNSNSKIVTLLDDGNRPKYPNLISHYEESNRYGHVDVVSIHFDR